MEDLMDKDICEVELNVVLNMENLDSWIHDEMKKRCRNLRKNKMFQDLIDQKKEKWIDVIKIINRTLFRFWIPFVLSSVSYSFFFLFTCWVFLGQRLCCFYLGISPLHQRPWSSILFRKFFLWNIRMKLGKQCSTTTSIYS